MMNASHLTALSALAIGLFGACATPDAQAVTRFATVNASGACQSSLPVFDVQIRKRPLAVQNEGTAPAYVTCSFYAPGAAGGLKSVLVYASVNDQVADTLTCTGVSGVAAAHDTTYSLKSLNLVAGGAQANPQFMEWLPSDVNPPDPFDPNTFTYYNFNINCNLNPGVGINNIDVYYDDGEVEP